MRTILTVSLPDKLNATLTHIAKEHDRSKSYIVQKAIESYAQEQNEMNIAFNRLHDSSDKIISLKELRAKLEL